MTATDHAEAVTPSPLPQPRILRWRRSTHPFWPIQGILSFGRGTSSRCYAADEKMILAHARMNNAVAIEVAEGESL